MSKTKSASIRLTLDEWAELDYAAKKHGRTRNDEVRYRLRYFAEHVPEDVDAGQASIFDVISEPEA